MGIIGRGLIIALAFTASAALSGAARADDVNCPPDLGNVTIDGNVLVAAPCVLEGTIVLGNVHLFAGGSLVARNVEIEGSIQGETSDFVDVADSDIDGNIQLDELVGDASIIDNNEVGGNIQLNDNRSAFDITNNRVDGDIQAFGNSGGLNIESNTVDGNLQCEDNNPAPTGGGNVVEGDMQDQCAALAPADDPGPGDDGGSGDDGAGGDDGSGEDDSGSGGSGDDSGFAGSGSGGGALGPALLALFAALIARRRRGFRYSSDG